MSQHVAPGVFGAAVWRSSCCCWRVCCIADSSLEAAAAVTGSIVPEHVYIGGFSPLIVMVGCETAIKPSLRSLDLSLHAAVRPAAVAAARAAACCAVRVLAGTHAFFCCLARVGGSLLGLLVCCCCRYCKSSLRLQVASGLFGDAGSGLGHLQATLNRALFLRLLSVRPLL